MYTVSELEGLSGLTRRTIGDYTAKGLLAGPSHRGRGARYSQADADALKVIPQLRTLMNKEFSSLRTIGSFMSQLSGPDLHRLASKTSEDGFVLAVRLLRVRISVSALLPQVPPEHILSVLHKLTPEQIRGIDAGRYQIGAIVDMAELLNGFGSHSDGHDHDDTDTYDVASLQQDMAPNDETESSWSVNWLVGHNSRSGDEADVQINHEGQPLNSLGKQLQAELKGASGGNSARIEEISERVARLERLLVTE